MEAILIQIKRLVVQGRTDFTQKAIREMFVDRLMDYEVKESILNAQSIRSKRSRSPSRRHPGERVYIIAGESFSGIRIYTKGVIRKEEGRELFYVLISSKRSTDVKEQT